MDYLVEMSENNVLETTDQKIANDLGTSRGVVSRLLKDFERKQKFRLSRNSILLLSDKLFSLRQVTYAFLFSGMLCDEMNRHRYR